MTAIDLRAWQVKMGLTYDTAAEALGMSRRGYANLVLSETPIDRRTALACAALAAGLSEFPKTANLPAVMP